MGDLPRLDALSAPPVVGQVYQVLCVRLVEKGEWVPVQGPAHDDRELIGFPWRHYHYLPEFMSRPALSRAVRRSNTTLRHPDEVVTWDEIVVSIYGFVVKEDMVNAGPLLRPRRCHRAALPYPLALALDLGPKLEPIYRDRRVECGRCPHRGACVAGLPVEADGAVTCRGHGLRFDAKTWVMVPRPPPPELERRAFTEGEADCPDLAKYEGLGVNTVRLMLIGHAQTCLRLRMAGLDDEEVRRYRDAWAGGFSGRLLAQAWAQADASREEG